MGEGTKQVGFRFWRFYHVKYILKNLGNDKATKTSEIINTFINSLTTEINPAMFYIVYPTVER